MLEPRGPFLESDEINSVLADPVPTLRDLSSLTPLQGKVSAIHTSAFFHLFPEEQQLALAHRFASLLSPQKGSIIFGQHGSRPEKGFRTEASSKVRVAAAQAAGAPVTDYAMFCHTGFYTAHLFRVRGYPKPVEIMDLLLRCLSHSHLAHWRSQAHYRVFTHIPISSMQKHPKHINVATHTEPRHS